MSRSKPEDLSFTPLHSKPFDPRTQDMLSYFLHAINGVRRKLYGTNTVPVEVHLEDFLFETQLEIQAILNLREIQYVTLTPVVLRSAFEKSHTPEGVDLVRFANLLANYVHDSYHREI